MNEIELHQMIQFQTAVETASLSGAAERLNLSQPALSKTIKHMESICRTQLLERTKRGVRPTAYGHRLIQRWGSIIDRLEQCVLEARAIEREKASIAIIAHNSDRFKALLQFVASSPLRLVHADTSSPRKLREDVLSRKIDIAIRQGTEISGHAGLSRLTIRHQHIHFIVPTGNGLSGEELAAQIKGGRELEIALLREECEAEDAPLLQFVGSLASVTSIASSYGSLCRSVVSHGLCGIVAGYLPPYTPSGCQAIPHRIELSPAHTTSIEFRSSHDGNLEKAARALHAKIEDNERNGSKGDD